MIKKTVITIILLSLIAVFILAMPSYTLWSNSLQAHKNLKRGEVHKVLGSPNQEWAKASSMDIWIKEFLFGGVRIDVMYSGKDCNWDNRSRSSSSCSVRNVYRTYYTIWGNSWFLSFQRHS
ncbi:hypothetical protein [Pseudoalteromonas sp. McH1-42]|uniref:hypothetical protein n=1 Tax=Pseudoalteromonas sp. McH1-42 TaxID=2917752 RepID=UPI001EF6F8EA|nr:hypothetical protein [Pseudoalteromonas sp. McH1-42]MCG7563121.1 hypothetical protein [Pseudoalteromonas sp. McH1-42]